jgi:hypothetical protein
MQTLTYAPLKLNEWSVGKFTINLFPIDLFAKFPREFFRLEKKGEGEWRRMQIENEMERVVQRSVPLAQRGCTTQQPARASCRHTWRINSPPKSTNANDTASTAKFEGEWA